MCLNPVLSTKKGKQREGRSGQKCSRASALSFVGCCKCNGCTDLGLIYIFCIEEKNINIQKEPGTLNKLLK